MTDNSDPGALQKNDRGSVCRILLVILPYTVVNGLCVFLPFIPGPGTFFSWGIILPIIFIVGSWVSLNRNDIPKKTRWGVGILCTLIYIILGVVSFSVIAEMWASV